MNLVQEFNRLAVEYGAVINAIGCLANVVIASLTLTTMYYLNKQSKQTEATIRADGIARIDAQFSEFDEVYQKIGLEIYNKKRLNKDIVSVGVNERWRFIGIFERCYLLIELNQITLDDFVDFYGYKLIRTISNELVQSTIKDNLDSHTMFIKLCEMIIAANKDGNGHIKSFLNKTKENDLENQQK